MKTSKTLSLTCVLFLALAVFFPAALSGQTVNPKGYWRFERPDTAENLADPVFSIGLNTAILYIRNTGPVAGYFFESRPTNAQHATPYVDGNFDNQFRQEQLSYEFWVRFAPGHRQGAILWQSKMAMAFYDNRIVWGVTTTNANFNGTQEIHLKGTGASDPQSIYDGQWHHFAFTFDLCQMQQKVYLDGVCPQGWSRNLATGGGAIVDGAKFYFGNYE